MDVVPRVRERAALPVHLRWQYVVLVALGGTLGTAARFLTAELIPAWRGVPLATLGVNVLGAFLLGLLLEALVQAGRDDGIRRSLRLLVGTGFLGGFTTYSSLAVETDALLRDGHAALAIAYALVTVVLGLLAAAGGIALAGARRNRSAKGAR